MKMILKYSKYSWFTWLFIKCLMALELGILKWIYDWCNVFNTLINFVFFRVSSFIFFFLPMTGPCWEIFYWKHTFNIYYLYLMDLAQGPIDMIQETVENLYQADGRIDIGLLIFFMIVCGDIANICCELKIRSLYRDVRRDLELKVYKSDYKNINYFKWKQFNSDEEIENYLEVREKVMEFITKSNISSYSVAFEENKSMKGIENTIKEEILKIKPSIKQKEMLKIKYSGKKQKPKRSRNNSLAAIKMETRNPNPKTTPENNKVKSPPVEAYDTIALTARVQSTLTGVDICWACGGSSLLRCSGCQKARYCGETCYRSDWEKHGEWCKWRREIMRQNKRNENEENKRRIRGMENEEKDEVD